MKGIIAFAFLGAAFFYAQDIRPAPPVISPVPFSCVIHTESALLLNDDRQNSHSILQTFSMQHEAMPAAAISATISGKKIGSMQRADIAPRSNC